MGTPTLGIDKVPGARFTAKVAPNGAFYSVTGPSETENKLAYDMADDVGRSLPRLKAILRDGAAWTDTVGDKVKLNGLDVTRDIVTKYTVRGDTTVAGQSGWIIARESAFTIKGAGTLSPPTSQAATVELTGTGKGVVVVSKGGVLLGGTSDESSSGTLVPSNR